MPNHVRHITIGDEDRVELERRARSTTADVRVGERARIVLLAAEGFSGPQIAERVGCSEPTVVCWRRRYAEAGLAGLDNVRRRGHPRRVLTAEVRNEILAATLAPLPDDLPAGHWSARLLSDWLGRRGVTVSHDSVSRTWREFGLRPEPGGAARFAVEPEVRGRVTDVAGVYLSPSIATVAIVLDESPPCLAGAGDLSGRGARRGRDSVRDGSACLFAALHATAARTVPAGGGRHQGDEFGDYLQRLCRSYSNRSLHLVCPTPDMITDPQVASSLINSPRVRLHATSSLAGWHNLVSIFFSIITRQAPRSASSPGVRRLVTAIEAYPGLSEEGGCPPLRWVKTPDAEIVNARRSRTRAQRGRT